MGSFVVTFGPLGKYASTGVTLRLARISVFFVQRVYPPRAHLCDRRPGWSIVRRDELAFRVSRLLNRVLSFIPSAPPRRPASNLDARACDPVRK